MLLENKIQLLSKKWLRWENSFRSAGQGGHWGGNEQRPGCSEGANHPEEKAKCKGLRETENQPLVKLTPKKWLSLKLETMILKFHFGGAISLLEATSSSHLPTVFKQILSLDFQRQLLVLEYFYGLSSSVLNKAKLDSPLRYYIQCFPISVPIFPPGIFTDLLLFWKFCLFLKAHLNVTSVPCSGSIGIGKM